MPRCSNAALATALAATPALAVLLPRAGDIGGETAGWKAADVPGTVAALARKAVSNPGADYGGKLTASAATA